MPRDAVSRIANVERSGGHKWVKMNKYFITTRKISQIPWAWSCFSRCNPPNSAMLGGFRSKAATGVSWLIQAELYIIFCLLTTVRLYLKDYIFKIISYIILRSYKVFLWSVILWGFLTCFTFAQQSVSARPIVRDL